MHPIVAWDGARGIERSMRGATLALPVARRFALALLLGCGVPLPPVHSAGPAPASPTLSVAAPDPAPRLAPVGAGPTRPRRLTLAQARQYMVELINRDRASAGLAPVTLDEGAPTRSGQGHAEDMAAHGYLGHFGTDGSVPEQLHRLTEAGGNRHGDGAAARCFTGRRTAAKARPGRPSSATPRTSEQTETMFFQEKPPNDGHRKNILTPWHTRVGIGVAQPVATRVEIPVPCFAQEFIDSWGHYAAVPPELRVGERLHVEGTVIAPATFAGVGLARVESPKPISVSDLNRRRSYPVPAPYQTYWPAGFKTPIPVEVSPAGHFAVDVPVTEGGRPGMYELSIWAGVPGSRDFVMVSLRTIQAR